MNRTEQYKHKQKEEQGQQENKKRESYAYWTVHHLDI